jgi:hypothetical protein
MGNVLSKVGKLQKIIFCTLALGLLGLNGLIPLIAASRASADATGNYAIQVNLSNPRDDVSIRAHRNTPNLDPKDVDFTGSGTTYKTDTIDHTSPATCGGSDRSPCTWSISVKDKSGKEIGSANSVYIFNKHGADPIGDPVVNINVAAASGGGGTTTDTGVGGKAQFKDWLDNNAIKNAPTGALITFTQTSGGTNKYTVSPDANGQYTIHNMSPGTYTATMTGAYVNPGREVDTININYKKDGVVIEQGKTLSFDFLFDSNPDAGTAADTSCADSEKDSNGNCPAAADTIDCGSGVLNWIACPVINTVAAASKGLDNFIMSTLDIDVKYIFDGTDQKGTAPYGYYTAWNSFRVIATALIVIAGLVMVVSQALGFEILDAYTIRRTLPRLVVAIIGISLSWPLMRFAIQLFDTLGFDVRGLMYGPFQSFSGHYSISTGILSTLGATAAILLMGPASLLLIVTVAITIFVGFLALVVRQIAIIVLVILAPIAIACYILPNTQRGWNLWRENFFGLLLAFPLISAAIAAGHIFAIVAINTSATGTASLTTDVAGLITHFTMHGFTQTLADTANDIGSTVAEGTALAADNAPKLLIPKIVQASVGAVSKLAGGAGGLFGLNRASAWLSKKRGEAAAGRFRQMQNQTLWDNNSWLGKRMNQAASWATDPLNNAAYYGRNIPGLRKRGAKVATSLEHQALEQSGKLFEELNKGGFNDKAYRLLSGSHDSLSDGVKAQLKTAGLLNKTPQSLQELQQAAHILSGSDKETERIAGNAVHGSMGRLATLYQDPEMSRANIQAAGLMGLAAHGFADGKDLAQVGNALQGEGGHQAAFAQSVVTQAQVMGARSRPDIKAGYGMVYKDGKFVDGTSDEGGRAVDLIKTLNSHDLAAAKGGALKKLAPTIHKVLDGGGGEATAVRDQLFSWAGPYSQASVDVKAQAINLINSRPELADAWKAYNRLDLDPAEKGGGGADPNAGGNGGGGPGGPGGGP